MGPASNNQPNPPSADPARSVRILLADDHEVVRQGLRALIEKKPEWQICGEASDGRAAVALAEKERPDIAVVDFGMPELNGLEATRQIKRILPECEVLVFTGTEDEELIHRIFAAGARSYILKNDMTHHLVSAIEALIQHKHYFTGSISEVLFARYLDGTPASDGGTNELTPREREIVQLLAEGKSNKEVASTLGISVKTVETHRATIMKKLRCESFAELVRYAIRHKIVQA
ncbi:MAG TPA: response regulator transcription factor [Chthoniobacterales bacterium]|nr:response regulator transcription factor [Chthoniobacterales bacterium]